ncbi:aldehyde dehydrogenase (NADP(+)) [Saccharomonospora piscinae]|uniref:aldehyde dehydrogenase (NADP(+)) n=1 Tax=Saccharomonospora piscinae TaxID=687388 RepID=UPI0011070175|nr:aldehyde dehydrogenase (NADP(+)) [Saccharomonospora piscinae]TLW90916.1 aldehyde dehydrogenase (NADP(+)) [Saccharomonospora piscinae]
MTPPIPSVDPATARTSGAPIPPSTAADVDAACARATTAFHELAERDRAWRAGLLRGMADELDTRRDDIVATADAETALGAARLNGELTRTCYQLRFFADVVTDGGYLEAAIDHAGPTPMGPRPDLRRMLVPLGPVAVFGASNFPLAFSVPGGDTAAALAAGCPVVVKAHESHPRTSRLCGQALAAAASACDAPEGTVTVVYGREAGARLVRHPAVTAVGFTGSLHGGRALLELVNSRPDPIPFYGELSGINPLVVTADAARDRAEDIGTGLASSVLLGAGQFCTKPGLAFVPATADGDRLVAALAGAVGAASAPVLLNEGIRDAYDELGAALTAEPGVTTVATGEPYDGDGYGVRPRVLSVDLTSGAELTGALTRECFGPVVVVVRYGGDAQDDQLIDALAGLEPSLTATVHLAAGEAARRGELLTRLQRLSGRLVFDGYPTGVAVSWAQHHGGPWPSTNAVHTSVGATAIRRFLRPLAWQDAPESVLPAELRDGPAPVPRRVDGALTLPGTD